MFAASSPNEPAGTEQRIADVDALLLQMSRLGRVLGHLKVRLARHINPTDGLEPAAYFLLMHLLISGPQRTTALAEKVHTDTSTVSRQITALVRHGLVQRQADPQDGRACLLSPTTKGERILQQHRETHNKEIAGLLAHWPLQDVRQLTTLLDRMNTELESYEPQAPGSGQPVREVGESDDARHRIT